MNFFLFLIYMRCTWCNLGQGVGDGPDKGVVWPHGSSAEWGAWYAQKSFGTTERGSETADGVDASAAFERIAQVPGQVCAVKYGEYVGMYGALYTKIMFMTNLNSCWVAVWFDWFVMIGSIDYSFRRNTPEPDWKRRPHSKVVNMRWYFIRGEINLISKDYASIMGK